MKNPYDTYIEELSKLFISIPNFDKIDQDAQMRKIFDSLCTKMIEISSLRELYEKYYCPAAKDCIKKQTKLIEESKYLHNNKEVKEGLIDIYYSTVRMGYVQLFHFVESYVNISLFPQMREICKESNVENIEQYCKKI